MPLRPLPPSNDGPILFVAPHRALFLSGGVMLLLGFVLWSVEIAARAGLLPAVQWSMPAGWMHALLVTSGIFPLYMFGFLLTAMPRWQAAHEVTRVQWLRPWGVLVSGWGAVLLGLFVPGGVFAGLVLAAIGWAGLLRILWRVAHASDLDALHARLICYGLAAGWAALGVWAMFAWTGIGGFARVAINLSVWACLLPVFATVCHRMLPFFSSGIIPAYEIVRPLWALAVIGGGSLVHGLAAALELPHWAFPTDTLAAGAALWLSWRWRLIPALKVPLLGMLHMGFLWLGIGFALYAAQGLAGVLGRQILGVAPLHALGVGFFGSVLVAMVSRVTLGHSGGKLVADRLTWGLFLLLEGVVLVRLGAELAPPSVAPGLMLLAVLGWLGIFIAWAWRYMPIYLRPRSDGRPG